MTPALVRRMRSRPGSAVAGTLSVTLAILLAAPLVSRAADAAVEAAYRRQFQALAADDLEGHLKLAYWCRDQQAYDLLLKECNYLLNLDPAHTQARLLLDLAKSKLPASDSAATAGSSGVAAPPTGTAPPAGKFKLLTQEQVQILRRAELKLDPRGPERVTVEFKNDVAERFWNLMASRGEVLPQDRAGYNKLSPTAKAQTILDRIADYQRFDTEDDPFPDTYSADIVIQSDPLVFKTFKTQVWPAVAGGCASAKCHGGAAAAGFSLYNERVMTDAMHYTNYLILHEQAKNGRRLIDRDHPNRSLLLEYGMPAAGDQTTRHPVDIPVVYRTPQDPKLQNIFLWIRDLLPPPAPDYGITLEKWD